MENLSMRDELDGSVELEIKNVEEEQEAMEFSTPISDVLDTPASMKGFSNPPDTGDMNPNFPVKEKYSGPASTKYPFNLKKDQIEALLAGLAGVIGFSDSIQNKLIELFPQMLSDSGKLTLTGMGATLLIIAVIFYFGRKFILNR